MKLEFSRQIFFFSKNLPIWDFMKIRPVGAELLHTDGRKDMTKLIVAFRSFANVPNNYWISNTKYINEAVSVWCVAFVCHSSLKYATSPAVLLHVVNHRQAVHILANNQLDAQFFCVCLFLFSTCFGQPCVHHQENYCINATLGLCHSA